VLHPLQHVRIVQQVHGVLQLHLYVSVVLQEHTVQSSQLHQYQLASSVRQELIQPLLGHLRQMFVLTAQLENTMQ